MQGWKGRQRDGGGGGGGEDNLFILYLKRSLHLCTEFSLFNSRQLILWLITDSIGVSEIDCRAALGDCDRSLYTECIQGPENSVRR